MKLITGRLKSSVRRVLGMDGPPDQTAAQRRGVDHDTWVKIQTHHELSFWADVYPGEIPDGETPRDYYQRHYHSLNTRMFTDVRLDCRGLRVLDVGCGPFGSLPLCNTDKWIGVDPLAAEYQRHYPAQNGRLTLNCQAERLPLLDESIDAVYCVNALDHFAQPFEALDEIHRVLRSDGYFALATDIGDTPEHPCSLVEDDVVVALRGRYREIEYRCSADVPSSWPADMKVPVLVFQGEKKADPPPTTPDCTNAASE